MDFFKEKLEERNYTNATELCQLIKLLLCQATNEALRQERKNSLNKFGGI